MLCCVYKLTQWRTIMDVISRQISDHLDDEAENERYSEQCQAWVEEILPELMAQAQMSYCIELPNNIGKHSSIPVDEILTDNDSQRYYKCMAHMMSDDEETRERFGRQAILTHLFECLERLLDDVSPQHVKRTFA